MAIPTPPISASTPSDHPRSVPEQTPAKRQTDKSAVPWMVISGIFSGELIKGQIQPCHFSQGFRAGTAAGISSVTRRAISRAPRSEKWVKSVGEMVMNALSLGPSFEYSAMLLA